MMSDNKDDFARACAALVKAMSAVATHPRCPDYLADILSDAVLSIANEIEDDARVGDDIKRIFARLVESR